LDGARQEAMMKSKRTPSKKTKPHRVQLEDISPRRGSVKGGRTDVIKAMGNTK
jgi:hypothetical protein